MTSFRFMSWCASIALVSVALGQESPKDNESKNGDGQTDVPIVIFRGHPTEVISLTFSADGSRVASISETDVCIWDSATGKEDRRQQVEERSTVGINQEFSRLAIARPFYFRSLPGPMNGKLTLKSIANGDDIWSIDPHGDFNRDVPFPPVITALAFSPDEKRLAAAGGVTKVRGQLPKGMVKIWDADTGKELRHFEELSARADAVAFSADGKSLAAGTVGVSGEAPEPAEVHVWNANSGQRLHTFRTRRDVEQGGNPGSVMKLVFSPNGTRLAAALSDGTVRLWELPSGKELFEMRGHQGGASGPQVDKFTGIIVPGGSVQCVAFSPDGSRLASAGYDRVVRVWDTKTGQQAITFRFDSARINAIAFSPKGQRLAAGGSNATKSGEVIVWKMNYEKVAAAGLILPTLSKAEMSNDASEFRDRIEIALKAEETHWRNLEPAERRIKDRIGKVLANEPTISDEQVALAVYLLTAGRTPTDEEATRARKEFADGDKRPLGVLQYVRGLVQKKDFNAPLADINYRLFKLQIDIEVKRNAGEIPVVMTADDFQKFVSDCAATVAQNTKSDEQFVDLAYLLTASRFPSVTEANQVVPHLKRAPDRAVATSDIFTFLLNSKEFLIPR